MFFHIAENVDYTLDRSNMIVLGQYPVNFTLTLLNDRIANETNEELQLTLVEINAANSQGEYLLNKVTITIADKNGIINITYSIQYVNLVNHVQVETPLIKDSTGTKKKILIKGDVLFFEGKVCIHC